MLLVVWMDSRRAECYLVQPDGTFEHHRMLKHDVQHHTHNIRDEKHPPETFMRDLSLVLQNADEVLIMGPGFPKEHFKQYLDKHHAQDIAKHIVGVETVDHPTEPQIKAHALAVFKRLHPHFPVS